MDHKQIFGIDPEGNASAELGIGPGNQQRSQFPFRRWSTSGYLPSRRQRSWASCPQKLINYTANSNANELSSCISQDVNQNSLDHRGSARKKRPFEPF